MVMRCLGLSAVLLALFIGGLRVAGPRLFFYLNSAPASHPRFPFTLEPKLPCLHVRHLPVPVFMDSSRIDYLENEFKHFDRDIWVTTYAKVGTTWMRYIVTRIFGYKRITDLVELFEISPWPEAVYGIVGATKEKMESTDWSGGRPRVLMSHWTNSDHMLTIPNSSRIIYVYREVEKVATSFYYHVLNKYGMYQMQPEDLTWDRFFEMFVTGEMEFGDYFDHVAGWWKVRDRPNVHLVRYEDLKSKPAETIAEIAKFLGKPLGNERVARIVDDTSLESMKDWESGPVVSVLRFFGIFRGQHIAGSGKDHLMSEEQKERLKKRYREMLEPIGVPYDHMFSK